jgi:hypothetical protein
MKFYFLRKSLFIVSIFILLTTNSFAQWASFFKSLVQAGSKNSKTIVVEETEAIAKNSLKNSKQTVNAFGIHLNKKFKDGYKNNVLEFWKKNKKNVFEESIDIGVDLLIPNDNTQNINSSELKILAEIVNNEYYPALYKKICNKFHVDSLSQVKVKYLLQGYKFNQDSIDVNDLYNIRFAFSNLFAKIELEKLKSYYGCEPEIKSEIDKIAIQRNIVLEDVCEDDESTTFELIVGVLLLVFLISVIYITVKRTINYLRLKFRTNSSQ